MINLDEKNLIVLEALLRNLNAEEQVLDKKSEKPLVFHKKHEQLSLVISGKGYGIKNNELFNIKRGSLIILNKEDRHSFYCEKGKMTLLHLHTPKITGDEDRFIEQDIAEKWNEI